MVSWFKNNKKNFLTILLSLLTPFASMKIGINPFIFAFVGALVILKIPIAIPFIIGGFLSYFAMGITGVTEIVVFTLIFAVIQSFIKKKGGFKRELNNFALAMLFTSVLLLIVKVYSFSNLKVILLQFVLAVIFLILYRSGLKSFLEFNNKTVLNRAELFALVCVILAAISPLKVVNFWGISLFSLFGIILIMLLSCKRKVLHAIITAIIILVIMTLFDNIVPLKAILVILVAVITALLSRAEKKGFMLGITFSVVFSIIMLLKISEESGVHSIASQVLIQMAVGFITLYFIPEGLYRHFTGEDDLSEKIKSKLEKMFPKRAKFLLSPGKSDKGKD